MYISTLYHLFNNKTGEMISAIRNNLGQIIEMQSTLNERLDEMTAVMKILETKVHESLSIENLEENENKLNTIYDALNTINADIKIINELRSVLQNNRELDRTLLRILSDLNQGFVDVLNGISDDVKNQEMITLTSDRQMYENS